MTSKSEHAIKGSGGEYCCHCNSSVGDAVKVQPTRCDGETFCPRCWCWKRCLDEPERFNATQMCATRCGFCGWLCVCFGALPGMGLRCSHCGRYGAMRVKITKEDAEGFEEIVHEAKREARLPID